MYHQKEKMTNTTNIKTDKESYYDLSFALSVILLITILYFCLFRKERVYEEDLI